LSFQAHSFVFQYQRQAYNRSIRAQVEIPAFHNSLTAVNETSARDSENNLAHIWQLCVT